MKLRSVFAGGAALTAVAVAFAAPAVATKKPAPAMPPTIADVLLSDTKGDNAKGFDNNRRDYDIVTQAVLAFPGLAEAAGNRDAELTVFAPTDQAFRILVWDLTGDWYWSEEKVFNAVVALGLPTVEAVLKYHIVPQAIPASAALEADGAKLPTLLTPEGATEPATIEVDVIGKWHGLIRLIDNDPDAANPWVVAFNVGGKLDNGYIHGINRVLRPLDLPQRTSH